MSYTKYHYRIGFFGESFPTWRTDRFTVLYIKLNRNIQWSFKRKVGIRKYFVCYQDVYRRIDITFTHIKHTTAERSSSVLESFAVDTTDARSTVTS